jgi:hypothetical protein
VEDVRGIREIASEDGTLISSVISVVQLTVKASVKAANKSFLFIKIMF